MPLKDIVSSLIMQLLQVRSKDLRDWKRFDAIHRTLQSDLWSKDLYSMCKTVVTVLEELETVNIILDRIDWGSWRGRAPSFVERLLKALSASYCHTWILLVTEPTLGTAWEIDLTDDMKWKHMYLEIRGWDQEVMSDSLSDGFFEP